MRCIEIRSHGGLPSFFPLAVNPNFGNLTPDSALTGYMPNRLHRQFGPFDCRYHTSKELI